MKRKIIVAGAGHGGLAVGADLAKKGFDVTVIEKKARADLGYDWTDIFAGNALIFANVPYPARDKYEYKKSMTFYNPSKTVQLVQDIPQDQLEIKMERKDIYEHLITHAEKCGVKFLFECEIKAPLMLGSRVCGVKTAQGDFYCDLVIDAAGIDSPVRTALPAYCAVENNVGDFEQFYVYRAFYERVGEYEPEHEYQVYILHNGEREIAWLATEGKYADVLIGRFEPLTDEQIEKSVASLREDNPQIGQKVVRGGTRVKIPVRQPLSMMVADGYAAIGDSAFMTVPLIGSGIANSLKAALILSKTISADKHGEYTARTLWQYQCGYYKMLGAGFAQMACVKLILLRLKKEELDFIFENGILTAREMSIGADSTDLQSMLKFSASDVLGRAKALVTDKVLLAKIVRVGSQIAAVAALTSLMPRNYTHEAALKWVKKYTAFYKKLEE